MEVKVELKAITIKDENTGEEFSVMTVRAAKDIAAYIEESEKDEVVRKLEEVVWNVYNHDK